MQESVQRHYSQMPITAEGGATILRMTTSISIKIPILIIIKTRPPFFRKLSLTLPGWAESLSCSLGFSPNRVLIMSLWLSSPGGRVLPRTECLTHHSNTRALCTVSEGFLHQWKHEGMNKWMREWTNQCKGSWWTIWIKEMLAMACCYSNLKEWYIYHSAKNTLYFIL